MNYEEAYRIFPLGDAAITIDFGNSINETINQKVLAGFAHLQKYPLPGIVEAVPAYSSLTLHYDISVLRKLVPPSQLIYDWVKEQLEQKLSFIGESAIIPGKTIRIPVCYEGEMAPDLETLATSRETSAEEVVRIHSSSLYRVYMLGFLPGFAYLGQVDEKISMPRKQQPAIVAAGSVGIAGSQTGIYPFSSPGGWQIIGRTPLILFDAAKEDPALIKAGDMVQFYPITTHEFENY
jgi:inhibitor of KinA